MLIYKYGASDRKVWPQRPNHAFRSAIRWARQQLLGAQLGRTELAPTGTRHDSRHPDPRPPPKGGPLMFHASVSVGLLDRYRVPYVLRRPPARATASTASAGATEPGRGCSSCEPRGTQTELHTGSRARPFTSSFRSAPRSARPSRRRDTRGGRTLRSSTPTACGRRPSTARPTEASSCRSSSTLRSTRSWRSATSRPAAAGRWSASRVAPTTGPSRCCPARCGSRCAVAFDDSRSGPPSRPGRRRPRCIGSRRCFSATSRR